MTTFDNWGRAGSLEQEVWYLDLDDDGLPDAVLTVETLGVELDGQRRSIEQIETLEMQIDIEGTPHKIQVVPTPA